MIKDKYIIINLSNYINVIDLYNFFLINKYFNKILKEIIISKKKIYIDICKKYKKKNIINMIEFEEKNNIIKFAITSGLFKLNIITLDNSTPLMVAAYKGNIYAIDLLINYNKNTNINSYDIEGNTALWLASHNNKINSVKKLLKYHNLNINQTDIIGKTALWIASACGNEDVVRILIENGAENIKDDDGRTPIQIAKMIGNDKIVEILIQNKYN